MEKEHEAFSDAEKMSSLICDFSHTGLDGHWYGSSHGFHPRGIIRNGILFQDEWNSNNYTYIKIPDSPDIQFTTPEYCPTAWHSNATPEPIEGELTTIWARGKWGEVDDRIKIKVIKTFNQLMSELAVAKDKIIKKEQNEKRSREQEAIAKKVALTNAWI